MEALDTASRYRSRILREMNANRDNPFNSPPSSTGSHGSVTLSSVFSDPDGESTRKLNEDIARVTAPRKLPVNWEAANRKWPEFYSVPNKNHDAPLFDDMTTDLRSLSAESKENHPPKTARFNDETTQENWGGNARTRAEMQPRVDDESDLSSILSKPPARAFSSYNTNKNTRHSSPLSKVHNRAPSNPKSHNQHRPSINEALDRLRKASQSPKERESAHRERSSPHMSSAKSSLTAVPSSPVLMSSPGNNASHIQSFFMPDVSHLGDFVTGTLRFTGSVKNGVPILVKHGKVHDKHQRPATVAHADVDALEVPEDEEKIFVSMDMIREEIVSLQEHYDKVQEYASNLQQQVEDLEQQLKTRNSSSSYMSYDRANEHLLEQKKDLEIEVATLQSKLEQASRRISLNEIENDSLSQEKERAVRKLQEACDDISKLTHKLNVREKELETSHRQMGSTEQMRHDNDTLRQDLVALQHSRDALELENASLQQDNENLRQEQKEVQGENESLRVDNDAMRRQHQSLLSENKSLRSMNKNLIDENEELRASLETLQNELETTRHQLGNIQHGFENAGQERSTLREDNESLVRHNEKYFSENKILRRENSGFERSIHELHEENLKLKDEVEFLKQQLDHCRPVPKEDFSAQLDEETEENMTSAFFLPDITVNTNPSEPEITETKELPILPELTSQTDKISTVHEATEQTQKSVKGKKEGKLQRATSSSKGGDKSSKVAFSIPEDSIRSSKGAFNMPNQGSKRRSTSQQKALKKPSFADIDTFPDDSTGLVSGENTTQEFFVKLNKIAASHKSNQDEDVEEARHSRAFDLTNQSQKSQRARSQSRVSQKQANVTTESFKTDRDTCPTLSGEARKVLDGLCEHSCKNCIVCARITSHHGVISSRELASGKKRVTVPRPVPVTDRDLSVEDPTMRPSQSPGHALALVIKGLEDESRHMELDLQKMQGQYNGHDKSLGRRQRLALADGIRTMLKRLETKNDQIYSLYDVLEGQKAAGQAMSEEEMEMTVLSITGMTVRDVTNGSEQMTWEGVPEI